MTKTQCVGHLAHRCGEIRYNNTTIHRENTAKSRSVDTQPRHTHHPLCHVRGCRRRGYLLRDLWQCCCCYCCCYCCSCCDFGCGPFGSRRSHRRAAGSKWRPRKLQETQVPRARLRSRKVQASRRERELHHHVQTEGSSIHEAGARCGSTLLDLHRWDRTRCHLSDGGAKIQLNVSFLLLFPHPGAISPMGAISRMITVVRILSTWYIRRIGSV